VGPPKHHGAQCNLPPTLHLDGPGCLNNVLINNALRKLTQCINALKNYALTALVLMHIFVSDLERPIRVRRMGKNFLLQPISMVAYYA